jgi:hypothetical protein
MFIFVRTKSKQHTPAEIYVSKVFNDEGQAMREAEQDMCDWFNDDDELIRQTDILMPPYDDVNIFRIEWNTDRYAKRFDDYILTWEVFELEQDNE